MLSIIIPTLNEEKYLPRLLDSILNQNFSDYEIIVSDAGSKDLTQKIAVEKKVRLIINDKIKHPSFQRNQGAQIAQGEQILFLDADSVLPPGFLQKAVKEFFDRKLTAASFYIRFNPNRWYYNIYSFISNFICFLKQRGRYPAAMGAAIIVSRSFHQKIKGFDLEIFLSEDCDYCARIAEQGKFRMIKSCTLLYSSRRIQKEGFFTSGWKWFKMGIFTLTNRRIKKKIIKYDFGKF
jgi:glycosyltransferase involved in cell wall biosynthesis